VIFALKSTAQKSRCRFNKVVIFALKSTAQKSRCRFNKVAFLFEPLNLIKTRELFNEQASPLADFTPVGSQNIVEDRNISEKSSLVFDIEGVTVEFLLYRMQLIVTIKHSWRSFSRYLLRHGEFQRVRDYTYIFDDFMLDKTTVPETLINSYNGDIARIGDLNYWEVLQRRTDPEVMFTLIIHPYHGCNFHAIDAYGNIWVTHIYVCSDIYKSLEVLAPDFTSLATISYEEIARAIGLSDFSDSFELKKSVQNPEDGVEVKVNLDTRSDEIWIIRLAISRTAD